MSWTVAAGPRARVQRSPGGGDSFAVLEDEKEVRDIAQRRQRLQREQGFRRTKEPTTLEELYAQVQAGEIERLNVILKGTWAAPWKRWLTS